MDEKEVVLKIRSAKSEEEAVEIYIESVRVTKEEREKLTSKGNDFLTTLGSGMQELLNSQVVREADAIEELRDEQLGYIADKVEKILNILESGNNAKEIEIPM